MTRVVGGAHTVRVSRRPKEWETWQGRLLWMIRHVVPSEMSLRSLSTKATGKPTALAAQIPRLEAGGDLNFSTIAALQAVLGFSWDWLAENKGWPTEEIRRRMGGSAPPIRAV